MLVKNHLFGKIASVVMAATLLVGTASAAPAPASVSTAPVTKEQWVKQNAHEIKSLNSDDFSDLAFLKPILQNKKVVSLGENFHRVAEYGEVKTRLIKYLHEELGYDVIAFESGMGDAAFAYENRKNLTPAQMMEQSIFPIWFSKDNLELFKYIKEQSTTDHPLYLAGYDMQFTSVYLTAYIANWIGTVDQKRGQDFYQFDLKAVTELYAQLNKYMLNADNNPKYLAAVKKVQKKYEPKYLALITWVNKHKQELAKKYPNNPQLVEFINKALADRTRFIKAATLNTRESYSYRDQAMINNLEWLMKTVYPGKKVILWAHNDHLAKNTSKIDNAQTDKNGTTKWIKSFTSMGELLHKKLQDDIYVLGLYMNQGQATEISTGKLFNISPMPEGSLEHTLMSSGFANTFVDFTTTKDSPGSEWLSSQVYAAEDGMIGEQVYPMSMRFVPREQFDGILLIDRVKAPNTEYEGGMMQQQNEKK
ncbi:erythromycin esterase family protein [Paenibacillus puldeungensis]|uniref:Erythromycin esterase family protein n=1 Tax=Paenibacillus puldeungensis TaxID=696536 RepID=A0ABW3RYA4_9BACL